MKSFRTVVNDKVQFSIAPDSPCPCESGEPAQACCLTSAGFHKSSASSTPPPPMTGNSLDSCYAADLADCGTKLSREHYISDSLLRYLNRNNGLKVSGLSWMDGGEKLLPPGALASKILCDRHNASLSSLDAIAVRLFKAFDESGATGSGKRLLHLFSGHDLERWLLKILCGLTYSGNATLGAEAERSIPREWLEILFGYTQFVNGQGLYVCKSPNHRFEGPTGLQLSVIAGRGRLTGMGLWLCGYELVLSMSGFPSRKFDGRQFAYRPLEFYTTGYEFDKSVVFSWEGEADLGTVSLKIEKT